MQVITDAFDVGYLANQHCRWFGVPGLADCVFKPLKSKVPSGYQSKHGRTEQPSDPAECGAWWYRFFRREPAYVRLDDVSKGKMAAFRRSLMSLESAIGRPLVFKNLYASVRMEPIAHYLPSALFLIIERDWVDNGQSILKGRYDALGDYGRWWSVPPPEVGELEQRPPVQQVVGQIESLHRLLDADIERLGLEDRTFRVRYEDFCSDVHGTLDRFHGFMARHGVVLEWRFAVPATFKVSRSVKIPQNMYDDLVEEVNRRQGSGRAVGAGT